MVPDVEYESMVARAAQDRAGRTVPPTPVEVDRPAEAEGPLPEPSVHCFAFWERGWQLIDGRVVPASVDDCVSIHCFAF